MKKRIFAHLPDSSWSAWCRAACRPAALPALEAHVAAAARLPGRFRYQDDLLGGRVLAWDIG
jgi:hypothetical protein